MVLEAFKIPPQGLADLFSRQDELMLAILNQLRAEKGLPTLLSEPELKNQLVSGQLTPYEIIGGESGLSLTTARTNAKFRIQADQLSAQTDGTLAGVTIKFNRQDAHAVPIQYFNPWRIPFYEIYLTHTAQSGKTLYLVATRQAGIGVSSGTASFSFLAEMKNKVSAVLDSYTTPIGIAGTYTSQAFSVEEYGVIVGSVFANLDGTLTIQQTEDGTNYDIDESVAYAANALVGFITPVLAPIARVRFDNPGAAQTTFRLYVRARRV